MNLLDENIPTDQRDILTTWGLRCRVIGVDVAYLSVGDDNIVSLLHHLKQPTLFTRDQHFFHRSLCHAGYCLVWLDFKPAEAAEYIRRFLRHPRFHTKAKRMGVVARAHHDGVEFHVRGQTKRTHLPWEE